MSTTKLTLAQKVANLNTPLTWDNIQNKPPFGTEANTILEGSKFIEGLGVNGYGGTIQDPGQKVAGKCYFDINTKSLFLCKTTNNLTSPNSDYFTSFDNKSLLNKLENLYRQSKLVLYNGGSPVPNGTVSLPLNKDWRYMSFALNGSNGKDRISFLVNWIFGDYDAIMQFSGIKLLYTFRSNTLKVLDNGGNLYYIEQMNSLT
jgi:hypothetical protein fgonA2_06654